eukprot:5055885-Amphidinium_carterae.3
MNNHPGPAPKTQKVRHVLVLDLKQRKASGAKNELLRLQKYTARIRTIQTPQFPLAESALLAP